MLVGVPFVSYSSGILLVYALGSFLHWRMTAWCGLLLPGKVTADYKNNKKKAHIRISQNFNNEYTKKKSLELT
jgi:hypothetical protein